MKNTLLPVVLALIVGGALLAFFALHKGDAGALAHPFSLFGNTSDASSTAAAPAAADPSVFTEPSLGFSFRLPSGYKAQKILNDTGETVLVQDDKGAQGFQVVITPFSDPGSSITKARVEKEAGLTVANDAPLTVASVAQGLKFDDNSSSPPLRDAWFAYNGYLYQAQVWKSDAALLDTILSSWQFN
jgi:hypothetical protein